MRSFSEELKQKAGKKERSSIDQGSSLYQRKVAKPAQAEVEQVKPIRSDGEQVKPIQSDVVQTKPTLKRDEEKMNSQSRDQNSKEIKQNQNATQYQIIYTLLLIIVGIIVFTKVPLYLLIIICTVAILISKKNDVLQFFSGSFVC